MKIFALAIALVIIPTFAEACAHYGCQTRLQYFENGSWILISLPGNVAPWTPAVIIR